MTPDRWLRSLLLVALVEGGSGNVLAAELSPMETVVVGTNETQTSGSVHVIKASKLQRFEYDDPHQVLAAVPGVYVRGEDGIGLRPNIGLRGGNSDRSKKVTLLEDGVLFGPAPYSAPAAYYFPLITRMQSMRVLKGPSAIVHGPNTVGGSVELLTRDVPQGQAFGVDAALGQYLYGKAHGFYGLSNDRWGVLLEGLHLRSDGFKRLDGGGGTGFYRNEWMAKVRHRFNPASKTRHALTLKAGYSDEVSNETYLGLTDADFRENPLRRYLSSKFDRMAWHRTQVSLNHLLERGTLTLSTTLYRHDLDRTWRKLNRLGGSDIGSVLARPASARNAVFYGVLTGETDSSTPEEHLYIGPNHRTFVSQGLQTIARWNVPTGPIRHALEAGARWHFDSIRRRHTEDAFDVLSGALVQLDQPSLVTADNHESTHAIAIHLVDAITWGPLTLTPGARIEVIRSLSSDAVQGLSRRRTLAEVMPGVGLYGAVTEHLGVFAGAHKGFSPPPPGQPVAPEESINCEAGVRWARRQERVEAIGFFNDYKNLTNLCTFSNGCLDDNLDAQLNVGRARIFGLEVLAEKTFRLTPSLRLPLSATYTFTKTRLLSNFTSNDPLYGTVRVGDEVPYVPAHQFSASAGIETEEWGLHLNGVFVDVMRERAGQGPTAAGERTDSLFTLDASASWTFLQGAQLYVNARNLLNAQAIVSRAPFGARPNAPRIVQFGVKYGF
ncbi:MAG: TonB-dependent receptor family protein [Myxococcaceae bacterium]